MSELLNYKLHGKGPTVVLIHGLFGNLDNLGLLARELERDHQVLSMDLRNHGLSFHSNEHTYSAMADDVQQLITSLELKNITLIGHSMGGKVAIKLASQYADNINKLIVLDMAPVAYIKRKHDNVFSGLQAVQATQPQTRVAAMEILEQHIELDGVRQFLGKSLFRSETGFNWRFNVKSIMDNYNYILGWDRIEKTRVPTLFIKGGESDYLTQEHQPLIQAQFTDAKAHVIANTGHWLHAEKPQEVIRVIRRFLDKK